MSETHVPADATALTRRRPVVQLKWPAARRSRRVARSAPAPLASALLASAAAPVLLAGALLVSAAAPASAQRVAPSRRPALRWAPPQPAGVRLFSPASAPSRPDSVVIPRTQWLAGGVLLGLMTGGLFAAAGVSLCEDSEMQHGSCLLPTLFMFSLGGMFGFTIGALIGGQISAAAP